MSKNSYLLVNSTNEFLQEYTPLCENARYKLTNFSGSTGDALVCGDKIYLFVDGRYHAQADLEVNHAQVEVVKLQVGETFLEKLFEIIEEGATLQVVSKKNSEQRVEYLEKYAQTKIITLKLVESDGIETSTEEIDAKEVPVSLGLSTEEKVNLVTKNLSDDDAIFTANQEEISYILNKRDFSKNYSSAVKKQKAFITKAGVFPESHKVTGKIYADKTSTNTYDFRRLNAIALEINPIKALKAVKTADEIAHYKECFKKTDDAVLATREFIETNDNISEYDIEKTLEENFYKYGAKSLSFKSIVAKDQNSAQAHYSKSSKEEILKDGSLILIDCGAYYEGGLATDSTRVFVKGEPTTLQREVYTKVLKAFLNAFATSVTTNTTGFEIDEVARKLLNKIKPDGFEFSHSLGHGIGISVHENPPSLSPSELGKTLLKPNMCFTIEPGLYNESHFGIRLENSCYLDENYKIQSFSHLPFEEKLIDYTLLTQQEQEILNGYNNKH